MSVLINEFDFVYFIKLDDLHVGDKAKVFTDQKVAKRLQAGHGEWAAAMAEVGMESSDL